MSWVRDFTTYQGRLNRIQLLWRHVVVCFVGAAVAMPLIAAVSAVSSMNTAFAVVMPLVMIPVMYAGLSLVVRRFHDVGLSGWWLLVIFGAAAALFAVAGIWPSPWLLLVMLPINLGYLAVLFLVPGAPRANRFGEPPAGP